MVAEDMGTEVSMEMALFRTSLYQIGRKMPADPMGMLWQIHQMYGESVCAAHQAGGECCVNMLLASSNRALTIVRAFPRTER